MNRLMVSATLVLLCATGINAQEDPLDDFPARYENVPITMPMATMPEIGIWKMEYDGELDGELHEPRRHRLVLSCANDRIGGHYEDHHADGKSNDSIFSGSLVQGYPGIVSIRQDDRPAYTAMYTGTLVEPGRITGSYFDNHGNSGDWTLTLATTQIIDPLSLAPPDEAVYESVLGTYGKAIRGDRYPYVNLRPPNRNLWTEEIELEIHEELSYGEVDYIGTAMLIIPERDMYRIEMPDTGVEFRLNKQVVPAGEIELKAGVYEVEIYTNHWGQPYLKYAEVSVVRADAETRIPFVNTQGAIDAFRNQTIDGRPVREVCEYVTPVVADVEE